MDKGTPLLKALFIEHRLPWRYKKLIPKKALFYLNKSFYKFSKNINTRDYWNKKLDKFEGDKWRIDVYEDLLKLFPKNKNFSLLDIGCALGDGCLFIKKRFPNAEISGCDFSDKAITKAKNKTKDVDFFVLDILKQKIPKKYDYISLVSILEHFDNPYYVINECLEMVNECLIINSPYYNKISYASEDEHRFAFNENSLEGYNHS